MQERITLTISTIRSAKHYSIGKLFRYGIFISIFVLVLTLVCSIGLAFWFKQEAQTLDTLRMETDISYKQLLEQQELLHQETLAEQYVLYQVLEEERSKVNLLDSALERIEDLVGADSTKNDENNFELRIQIAEQNSRERKRMLAAIPSGYPLKGNKRITSGFGYRNHPIRKKRELHAGIDFAAKVGTPVYATADAVVEFAGRHRSGYGILIILSHSLGFRSLYAHLNSISIKVGQVVKKGDVIGTTGRTGVVTGPHLHYEITYVQRPLNPRYFVRWDLENYEKIFKQVRYVPWQSLVSLTAFQAN